MQALNVVFIGLMAMIAAIDYKTFRVPLWALVGLCVLVLLKGHLHAIDAILGLLFMLVTMRVCDLAMSRETIGGGDLWICVAMSAFMGFDKFIIAFTVAAILGQIACITIHRKHSMFDMAYVPYLAAGAFWALFIAR